jgi:disulfide bond formation protein DsbB
MKTQTWWTILVVQAVLATLGSLYYGYYGDPVANIALGNFFPVDAGYPPCDLCRYARILMYPLVRFGLYGMVTQLRQLATPIFRVSVAGIVLEIYHYILQNFPIDTGEFCTKANPCNALSVDYFGFITIPFLCLIAFVVIAICARNIMRSTNNK